MRTLLGLILACLFTSGGQADADGPKPVPKRILFVGNSYTGGVKNAVAKLFAASPHRGIEIEFIHPGGVTLERHLGNAKTLAKIREGKWDIVILQEQSQTPAYPGLREKFLKAAEALGAEIRKAGAKPVFYQTWGRRDGDKANGGKEYAPMQDLLTEGYAMAARETGAEIAPVGEAWRLVWKEDAEIAKSLYRPDGSHPSDRGAFLAACVFYRTLTGEDPGEVEFGGDFPEEVTRILREAAKEATGAAATATR